MKKKFDADELEILNAYENNTLASSKNEKQEITNARKIAKNTLIKSKHISTLIHQYAANKIKIKI